MDFRFEAAGTDTGFGAPRHPRLVSAGCPYNAAGFNLMCAEIDPIPAGGQPERSHPIRVPGDCITMRIHGCHVPNKHILITQAVETVEKVPFRKLIFGKWDKNIEKRLVFCVPNNILAIFEPVVGDFCEDFSSKEFFDSLVGLLSYR